MVSSSIVQPDVDGCLVLLVEIFVSENIVVVDDDWSFVVS